MVIVKINLLEKLYNWFYTKSETDDLLDNKADSTHTHIKNQITDLSNSNSNTDGLMSSSDKRKLDNIEDGATKVTVLDDTSSNPTFNVKGENYPLVSQSVFDDTVSYLENSITNIDIVNVVSSLPDKGKSNCLYLVPSSSNSTEPKKYDINAWISEHSKWEQIDSFTVDLSGYYRKSETYSQSEVDGKVNVKADKSEALGTTGTFNAKGTTDEGCLVLYTVE